MLTVGLIAFLLFPYVGDPVTSILGQDATQEQRDDLRRDLGLDQAFPVQFARFVGNAVQGEAPKPLNPPTGCAFHPHCPQANAG